MSQKTTKTCIGNATSTNNSTFVDKASLWIYNKILKPLHTFKNKRQINSDKYGMTNVLLLLFFPLFIVLIAEVNQMKYVDNLIIFMSERPSIIVFDVICAALIFAVLLLLFKKAWFAVFLQTVVYFVHTLRLILVK